jgi:hypothetical protein
MLIRSSITDTHPLFVALDCWELYIVTCYSDYRRVLDWQLRLLDHSVHFTIHYSAYTL